VVASASSPRRQRNQALVRDSEDRGVSGLTGASITSPERPTPNFAASWNVAPTDPAPGRPLDPRDRQPAYRGRFDNSRQRVVVGRDRQRECTPTWSLYRGSHRSPASAIRADRDGAGYPLRDRRAEIAERGVPPLKSGSLYDQERAGDQHAYDRFSWQIWRRRLACISHRRWLIVGEMARCAVSESRAVIDTKGEYRRAHRGSVER
jgi:hypothetical protein